MKTRSHFLLVFIAMVIAPCLSAAFEFHVLSWQGNIEGLHYKEAGKTVEITASETVLTGPYARAGEASPLTLYRMVETPEGGKRSVIAARIPSPPAGVEQAVLLLARRNEPSPDGEVFSGRWFAAPKGFGEASFYNMTALPLAVEAGGQQWVFAAGESHSVSIDAKMRSMPIRIAKNVEGAWKLIASSATPVQQRFQVLVILRDGRPDPEVPNRPVEPVQCVALINLPPKKKAASDGGN